MQFMIAVGDRVQARKSANDDVATTEFTVTAIQGGAFAGSPLGALNTADGWTVELIRRGDPAMPDTMADIAVWLVENRTEPCHVFGSPAFGWRTADGRSIDPADVLHWEPWVEPEPQS